ncbi:MAG: LPS export ABC transporter periplasmic protein LptC [Ignavibacteriaceae bacterium]|nr:LPS export ABC transporter periplasmic protein LptC [Ignavibacteriaceae bacterium]
MRFLVLILFILVIGCSQEKVKPTVDESINIQELPTQESWKSKIVFTDSGKTKAILWAGHIRVYSTSMETLLDDSVKVDFYNPEEIKTTTMTSMRGKIDDNTKNLYAFENVVAVNDSGVTLKSEELMWRNSDQKIVTDKFVTITTPTENIQGYGFESDQQIKNYIIYKPVYVTNSDSLK